MEQRSLATAVKQVDNLFDSFNGSKVSPPDGKKVKCCVAEQSAHSLVVQKKKPRKFEVSQKFKRVETENKNILALIYLHNIDTINNNCF